MYGTQASDVSFSSATEFENDVKMYGTQAMPEEIKERLSFENDVKMYGTQAINPNSTNPESV